jgi:urease subunit beta
MIPGEYILKEEDIIANEGRKTVTITVVNTGDRPVQIGSHFHFFEVNKQMNFDRKKAFGMRLNIPAGTAVRFEPGEEHEVELVEFGGKKKISGFNNLTNGKISSAKVKEQALIKSYLLRFKNNRE